MTQIDIQTVQYLHLGIDRDTVTVVLKFVKIHGFYQIFKILKHLFIDMTFQCNITLGYL